MINIKSDKWGATHTHTSNACHMHVIKNRSTIYMNCVYSIYLPIQFCKITPVATPTFKESTITSSDLYFGIPTR